MLAQVPREAEQLLRELQQLPDLQVIGRETDFGEPFWTDIPAIPPLVPLRNGVDRLEREPESLADVADGRLGAVADDDAGDGGAVAAVFAVQVL
jgi:hypothetical protein